MNEVPEIVRNIFFRHALNRTDEFKKTGARFVHYTSAETAMLIFKGKKFWMRDPQCMNDYMEVQHGLNCLKNILNFHEAGRSFKRALDKLSVDLFGRVDRFLTYSPLNPTVSPSYVACLSEHDADEDINGRLSMWRAYGRPAGVAIVMNPSPILDGPGTLNIVTSPVAYFNESHFIREIERTTNDIEKNLEALEIVGLEAVQFAAAMMFRMAALSSKHEGFSEEREWRLIYSPNISRSNLMKKETITINNIPQTVYQIPLESVNGTKTGGELPELVDRIIIGPTDYPNAVKRAFIDLLVDAGVQNPLDKIQVSGIPLRTW